MGNENQNNKISFEELKSAAMPLVELLRKKGHPHLQVIVTDSMVKITEDKMGVPLEYED
jgi:hypothetical protein